jgi:hypothetical protein
MSGAERSYRIALLAFPKAYRRERGEEIVATILEGGETRLPRLCELFGLFWAGIGQRGLRAGGERTAGSVRAGIRLGAFALLWLEALLQTNSVLSLYLNPRSVENLGRIELVQSGAAVTGVIVLLALSRGWWAAPLVLTLAWELASTTYLGSSVGPSPHWLHWTLAGLWCLPALVCLLARPRRYEPRDVRSPLWAIAAPALGGLMVWYVPSWVLWSLAVLLAAWFVLGWRDLRLAIAGATSTTFFALEAALIATYVARSFWQANLIGLAFALFATASIAVGLGGKRVSA